jgi:GT2 family glycosyltransferase
MDKHTGAPVITAAIPTFRRPRLLRRTIRSVLRQTYPHVRVCVFDDASGDETGEIVAELAREDSRVQYYCHPQNIGLMANFAYAMEQVDTPYFSFVSDDDFLLPDFYQTALQALDKYPDAMFFAGNTLLMTDTGKVQSAPLLSWREGYYTVPEGIYAMVDISHIMLNGVLFKREVRERFGVVDKNLYTLDSDLLLRIAAHAPFVVSHQPSAVFVVHPGSTTVNKHVSYLAYDWPIILDKLRNDTSIPAEVRQHVESSQLAALKKDVFHMGVQSAARGKFADARTAAKALREQYALPDRAHLVRTVANVCQWLPPAYWGLRLAYKLQHRRYRAVEQDLQERYGRYASYLKL